MFSNALKLADLDDFVAAQDCVLEIVKTASKKPNLIKLRRGKKADDDDIKDDAPLPERAEVSLYDCLACSGCVTSAEVIFIETQNTKDLLKKLSQNLQQEKIYVISLCLQTRALFAARHEISIEKATKKLCGFFHALGFQYVLDMSTSDSLAIDANLSEFLNNLDAPDPSSKLPVLVSHCPGFVCYAEKSLEAELIERIAKTKSSQQLQGRLVKSLLAEKIWESVIRASHYSTGISSLLNPFAILNTTKMCEDEDEEILVDDLQATEEPAKDPVDGEDERRSLLIEALEIGKKINWIGNFRKEVTKMTKSLKEKQKEHSDSSCGCVQSMATDRNFYAKKIYHVAVAPCFDKKLESIREESNINQLLEVDLVVSSYEIDQLLALLSTEFMDLPSGPMDDIFLSRFLPLPQNVTIPKAAVQLPVARDGTSSGFARLALHQASLKYQGQMSEEETDEIFERLTNSDFHEATLKLGERTLRFWTAYGFRNIQNATRKVRENLADSSTKTPSVDFVEIMACPKGCLNGGGQRLVNSVADDRTALVQQMKSRITVDVDKKKKSTNQTDKQNFLKQGYYLATSEIGEEVVVVDPTRDSGVRFCKQYLAAQENKREDSSFSLTMNYRVMKQTEAGILASSLKW